ncbi:MULTISPECIES: SRPBCC family protein [unclassified Phenylobacterium]|uniref:SRPBCC family protein n=1 Tax=unclassified Phenylobacterium TaxID=2640670 RepID=UPI00083B3924|nr:MULTISPECIES: SRPBCC family protein [unclassified Phenylobacterium]
MFELSREVRVAAPPPAVWRVVTDLAGYRAWTKVVFVGGEPRVGAAITYQIAGRMRSGVQRAIRHEGTVKMVEADRDLVWTSGIPGLMGLRFGFALRPAGGATAVRHYLQLSGLAAFLFRGRLTRLYGPVLGIVTEDLARFMAKTRAASFRIAPDIRRRKRKT